jgi:hypothetical protein
VNDPQHDRNGAYVDQRLSVDPVKGQIYPLTPKRTVFPYSCTNEGHKDCSENAGDNQRPPGLGQANGVQHSPNNGNQKE